MHRLRLGAIAALLAISLAGCWPLFTPVQHRPTPAPARPAVAPSPSPPPPVTSDSVNHERTQKRTASRVFHAPAAVSSPAQEEGGQEDNANVNVEENRPSLTLAGEDSSKTSTEQLLDKVDRRLAAINRRKLTPADATTYDQASGFATSARQALSDHDYVIASGLAEKASALAVRLNPPRSSNRSTSH